MTERVWDRFLTAQDRERSAALRAAPKGGGKRPALLLVDLYRWVFGDEPQPLLEAIEAWPGSCGLAAWHSLPYIERLLEEARRHGIPVVHATGHRVIESWSRGSAREPAGHDAAMANRLARRYEIIDQLTPMGGEVHLRKSAPSAFWGTPIVGHLNSLDVDTIVVAGESTSGCVRATVVDGMSFGYRMLVPEECVFDRDEAPHAMNLFDMNRMYADVIPVDNVLEYLRTVAAERRPIAAG
jgi:nicotinamidase-related amidase